MRVLLASMIAFGLIGCGKDEPKVNVKTGPGGVEVNVPGAKVKTGDGGVQVDVPGAKVKTGG